MANILRTTSGTFVNHDRDTTVRNYYSLRYVNPRDPKIISVKCSTVVTPKFLVGQNQRQFRFVSPVIMDNKINSIKTYAQEPSMLPFGIKTTTGTQTYRRPPSRDVVLEYDETRVPGTFRNPYGASNLLPGIHDQKHATTLHDFEFDRKTYRQIELEREKIETCYNWAVLTRCPATEPFGHLCFTPTLYGEEKIRNPCGRPVSYRVRCLADKFNRPHYCAQFAPTDFRHPCNYRCICGEISHKGPCTLFMDTQAPTYREWLGKLESKGFKGFLLPEYMKLDLIVRERIYREEKNEDKTKPQNEIKVSSPLHPPSIPLPPTPVQLEGQMQVPVPNYPGKEECFSDHEYDEIPGTTKLEERVSQAVGGASPAPPVGSGTHSINEHETDNIDIKPILKIADINLDTTETPTNMTTKTVRFQDEAKDKTKLKEDSIIPEQPIESGEPCGLSTKQKAFQKLRVMKQTKRPLPTHIKNTEVAWDLLKKPTKSIQTSDSTILAKRPKLLRLNTNLAPQSVYQQSDQCPPTPIYDGREAPPFKYMAKPGPYPFRTKLPREKPSFRPVRVPLTHTYNIFQKPVQIGDQLNYLSQLSGREIRLTPNQVIDWFGTVYLCPMSQYLHQPCQVVYDKQKVPFCNHGYTRHPVYMVPLSEKFCAANRTKIYTELNRLNRAGDLREIENFSDIPCKASKINRKCRKFILGGYIYCEHGLTNKEPVMNRNANREKCMQGVCDYQNDVHVIDCPKITTPRRFWQNGGASLEKSRLYQNKLEQERTHSFVSNRPPRRCSLTTLSRLQQRKPTSYPEYRSEHQTTAGPTRRRGYRDGSNYYYYKNPYISGTIHTNPEHLPRSVLRRHNERYPYNTTADSHSDLH